ncbi:MAG: CRTAC1 family protein [Pirellula sp.]|jgi:hypothetical protein
MTNVAHRSQNEANRRSTGHRLRLTVGVLLLLAWYVCGCTSKPEEKKQTADTPASHKQSTQSRLATGKALGSTVLNRPLENQAGSPDLGTTLNEPDSTIKNGIHFRDVAKEMDIDFAYQTGAKGRMLFHEPFGGGHGWLDYDLDGRVDLILVQGGDGTEPSKHAQPNDRLLRNVGSRFIDITLNTLIDAREYGQGVAIADYDNDGFDDIYITNLGSNLLFKNQGDGTFLDVSKESQTNCHAWSTSAAWVDVDLDGNLDLYVCNYVKYDPYHAKSCVNERGEPLICNPLSFEPEPDVFYWNDGSGSFHDVTMERGFHGPNNRALGVVAADFDQDGWPDFYVANDASNNFLFRNLKNGYFEEVAVQLGCATDRRGVPQASMGLAVNDYNGDGKLDIYSTHFQTESNTLYQNVGNSGFIDVTGSEGLHTPTLDKLGFGTVMQDFNQDGCMDLFVANGHIDNSGSNPNEKMEGQLFTYKNKKWHEISNVSGEWFQKKFVSRGVTYTDFDLDGKIDLGITNQSAQLTLLHNESSPGRVCWLKLVGVTSNRNGVGAKITVETSKCQKIYEVIGGGSYCSASSYFVPILVAPDQKTEKIHILWPSGIQQQVAPPHYGVLAIYTETALKRDTAP